MIAECRLTIKDAISNVMETMFFSIPEFIDSSGDLFGEDRRLYCESSIELRSEDSEHEIRIQATKEMALMVTANFLGVYESEVDAGDLEDAMKELANMVGGDYLARIAPIRWQLGLPQFRLHSFDKAIEEDETSVSIDLLFDGEAQGRLILTLRESRGYM